MILAFIPGEDLSVFDSRTHALLEAFPNLGREPSLNAVNEGVTLVWLR